MRKLMSNWKSDLVGALWVATFTTWITSSIVGNIYVMMMSSVAMIFLTKIYVNHTK